MDDLARKIDVARKALRAERDDAWVDRQANRFQVRCRSRARWRRASLGAVVVASLALVGAAVIKIRHETAPIANVVTAPAASAVSAIAPVRIPDGSLATPFDELTVLRMKDASDTLDIVELVRGGARFSVVHKPGRLFRVEAGPAVVEVLGTEFTVERLGARVRVSVLTGQVQVDCEEHVSQLVEGETAMFPRSRAVDEPMPETAAAATEELTPNSEARAKTNSPIPLASWRTLASQGKMGEAYQVLQRNGWPDGGDPASLLAAADVARLTHHPAQAVSPLRKMIDSYPKDSRVSAAAFTLGRVLIEIGDFRGAAEAFAKTRNVDQQGAISEDALAREVEAWSRAGDKARAKAQASEYILRYPSGRRLSSVRLYGGLE